MEGKTVLTASVSGTLSRLDPKEPEEYKITVVYRDGTKVLLRKKYEDFVDLQVKVYDLLKQKGGYSRKTSRTLISSLPENNSALSRILFKDSDLKKMGRMEEFIKELLTLPTVVRESEAIRTFFGILGGQQHEVIEHSPQEEELKKDLKVAEILSGRDPLRTKPQQSPLANRKPKYSSSWIPEDLHVLSEEAREHLYKKLNRLNERRPSKEIPTLPGRKRTSSVDDEELDKKVAPKRPGLRRRPFTVGIDVGLSDLLKESVELEERQDDSKRSQTTVPPPDAYDGLSNQQSGSDESISAQGDSSAVDSGYSEVEETRSRKTSFQFGAQNKPGRATPNRTKYVVMSSFLGEGSGEVSLEEGEEVEVLEKESTGWWYVKNDFCEGWAPSAFLAVDGRSRSPSPESPPSQPQILDNPDQSYQIEEKLDSYTDDKKDEKRLLPQGQEKSLDRNVAKAPQTKPTEMNRRAKFLTVEGIQKRKNPDKNYVYILKVVWCDGNINIIYRTCSDFFFLQENLRKECPTAIGKEIPALKGRKFTENCQFCFKDGTCKRQKFMNQFCHELVNAPDNISKCKAVMGFCRSRPSDVLPHAETESYIRSYIEISKENDSAKPAKNDGKTTENETCCQNVQISGPVVFEQYIVTADYKKKNKNDISLTAGDIVDVIERNDYGWWLVDREGELGWAPASHLEPTDDGLEITTARTFAPGKEEIYMSVKSYQAKADDELSFDVDIILKVVEKNLDGWWLVRYQGEEGWAPAMFLKRVDSDDSSTSASGKMNDLDIVSFNGDSEDGESQGISRTPPTRRSMVQRTIRRKPKKNSTELNATPEEENSNNKTTDASATRNSQSIPVPAKRTPPMNRSPAVSPRSKGIPLSRSSSRPRSGEFTQGDVDSLLQSYQYSISSSGYESSPTGSLSSLASDVFNNEERPPNVIKKSATLPRFETIEDVVVQSQPSPVIPRSRSVTSMAHYKKEMELSVNGISSTGRISNSGRNSPIPAPRKNSASNRRSPLAGSPPRGRESGSAPPRKLSGSVSPRKLSGSVSPRLSPRANSEIENEANSRLYRAMHTYISQEDGEVTFIEGDEIEVIQRSENGWWLVRTSEELGWGPSNFLQSLAH